MLDEIMRRVSEKCGAQLAVIFDGDGLVVEKHAAGSLEAEPLAAELAAATRSLAEATSNLGMGGLNEMTLSCSELRLLVRRLAPNYFMALAIPPQFNLGRARYELERACWLLEREFAG